MPKSVIGKKMLFLVTKLMYKHLDKRYSAFVTVRYYTTAFAKAH